MIRNAILMMERVAELNDRVKTARYSDRQYMNAINESIEMVVQKRLDPIKNNATYSFQSAQRVRDELTPLVTSATGSAASGLVAFPTDYRYYALLYVNVGSETVFCKPTNYNQEGDLKVDPFGKPTDDTLYFNERATGLRVLSGPTALGNYTLWYIKNPAVVDIGQERNKVVAGGTLTNALIYYVYDESVYNAVTYYPGETITGTGAALTSGTVIPTANVVNCDLPSGLQDEVCNLASAIMNGTTEDYYKKQSLQSDVQNS